MQSRREFITSITRLTALAALGGTTGYLLLRPKSEDKCDIDYRCSSCGKQKNCNIKKENKSANKKESNSKKSQF